MEITGEFILFAIVAHAVVLAIVFSIVFLFVRKPAFFGSRSHVKAKSLIEQRLVLETISACAHELEVDSIIRSVGKHAAEMTGFEEWVVWLRNEKGDYEVTDFDLKLADSTTDGLLHGIDYGLQKWVERNPSPVFLKEYVVRTAESAIIHPVLSRLINGVMIPFVDGDNLMGFIIVGGKKLSKEKRSEQFLSLFGAITAIIYKRCKLEDEERHLRQRLQREGHLANLGQLAAGLAHEIRNPLTFIRACVHQLHREVGLKDDLGELTDSIGEEINRINNRIEELLVLGRINPRHFSVIDLESVVNRAARFAESRASEAGVSIELELNQENTRIIGSEDLLFRLVLNLIQNGIEASKLGSVIEIVSGEEEGFVEIEVVDSGSGIAPEIRESIFDPFFTTKETGTGLGLSIAFSIAQAHGGRLELTRSDAGGSRFRLSLPLIGH